MLTVYLANKYIRAVEGDASGGKVRVQKMYETVDAGGVILNGTIVDEEALLALLTQFWQENHLPKKDVYLVMDSNQFTSRDMQIPSMNNRNTIEYLSREFTGVDRIENPVFGYFPIGKPDKKTKMQKVAAMAAPRDYIQKYIDIFAKLGVTLHGIESVRGALNRLFREIDVMKGKTCIVQIVDDTNLISMLWLGDSVETSNRKRMFADPGTPAYSVEMSRAANNLVQFAKAQDIEEEITSVYVAGITAQDLEIYKETIGNVNAALSADGLPLGTRIRFDSGALKGLSPSDALSEYALAIGGLLRTDASSNVITQMKMTPEQLAKRKERMKMLVPGAILVGVLVVASLILFVRKLYLQNQLDELLAYNQDPSIVQTCAEYDTLSARISAASGIANGLTNLTDMLAVYPKVNSEVKQILTDTAGESVTISLSGFDSTTGKVAFSATAADVEQINQYIERLMQLDILETVDYTGYAQDGDGNWKVNVQCVMAAEVTETETPAETQTPAAGEEAAQ